MPWLLYSQEKSPWYPLERRLIKILMFIEMLFTGKYISVLYCRDSI
jgi:hypothetical protein